MLNLTLFEARVTDLDGMSQLSAVQSLPIRKDIRLPGHKEIGGQRCVYEVTIAHLKEGELYFRTEQLTISTK